VRISLLWKSANSGRIPVLAALVVFIGGMLCAPPVSAIDLTETVQVHGFISQAYLLTDNNKFFGPSDKGSFEFQEMGGNLSWKARPNLQLSAQVTYRNAGDTAETTPRIDYVLADYTFYNDAAMSGGLRVGRYKNPFGLYNMTRDVPDTRPSILLPESIYIDIFRDMFLSMDGGQLYGQHRSRIGDFFLDVGVGDLVLDSVMKDTLGVKAQISYVGRLLYEMDGGRLRLAITGVDANMDSSISVEPNGKLNVRTYILSAQYNAENWSLTGEWQPEQRTTLEGYVPLSANKTTTGMSYYLQGSYRFAKDWEALLRYDVLYADRDDHSGKKYSAATTLPAYSRFAKDWTVGLGWNFLPGFLLRAEFHLIDGTLWLSPKENPLPAATKEHWNMFLLQASYSF